MPNITNRAEQGRTSFDSSEPKPNMTHLLIELEI